MFGCAWSRRVIGAELLAVHRQRSASRNAGQVGDGHHQRAGAPHLFLDQPDGVGQIGPAQAVGADQLREEVVLLRRRAPRRLLLDQRDRDPLLRELKSALAAGEASADDGYLGHASPAQHGSRNRQGAADARRGEREGVRTE
jgi:hypothetical protein